MALEWSNVDLNKRQLCVAQSEWKGHVTAPKGGRLRYVPLTRRLAEALNGARHLRSKRVLCDRDGKSVTQKVVHMMVRRSGAPGQFTAAGAGPGRRRSALPSWLASSP